MNNCLFAPVELTKNFNRIRILNFDFNIIDNNDILDINKYSMKGK